MHSPVSQLTFSVNFTGELDDLRCLVSLSTLQWSRLGNVTTNDLLPRNFDASWPRNGRRLPY